MEDIRDIVTHDFKGQCGIIYCLSRRDCEKVSAGLIVSSASCRPG